jgi:nucleotide-binding universal stress UspA family protein
VLAPAAAISGKVSTSGVMMRKTIRRILVAVDLAKPREAAFDRALLLARHWQAELYLLHTSAPRPVPRFSITGEDLELKRSDAERLQLRALVRSAKDQGVQVRIVTAHGDDSARAIAAHAHLVMADLIVVPRDFGSSRKWRTPRVAATLGRSAAVPVLIVPSRQAAPQTSGAPFKKIVVAVDFTVASAIALRVATELIAQTDARGTVVHALSYQSPMVFSGGEAFGVIDDLIGQTAQAETRLRGVIPAAASHRVKPRVIAGAAGQAILDVAAEVDADLVVMGVPRRHRLGEVLFGSTFRTVVGRSLRPILAVPVAAGAHRWGGEPPAHVVSPDHLRAA